MLAPLAPVKARITELMLERRLDKEKMTEKKATEMIVEAEYDLEKYTNYDFEKGGGKQQQQQQQPHQPTQRRIDGRYAAGQECKFGVACNDPKCRGIMTHKTRMEACRRSAGLATDAGTRRRDARTGTRGGQRVRQILRVPRKGKEE